MRWIVGATITLLAALPAMAVAKDKQPLATPESFQKVIACRDETDPAKRLACFDHNVAVLDAATKSRDIVVADKAQIRQARSGLFGFTMPSLKIFGGGGDEDDGDKIKEIETTIKAARTYDYGQWRITLADGAVWEQIDSKPVALDPRPGNAIKIKQGAFGSFLASIAGQPAIKVRRVQ